MDELDLEPISGSTTEYKINPQLLVTNPKYKCKKHGVHEYAIVSSIEGHKGEYCQICWVEWLESTFGKCERLEYGTGD
jgi:hypothetical protein